MTWPDEHACAPGLAPAKGRYALRPIRWEDREPIRQWRNEQIDVLRQPHPLSVEEQDSYFLNVIKPQMESTSPAQVLFGFTEDGLLVGYGGVVHINWADRRGEVSFLTSPDRLDQDQLTTDWTTYLDLLVGICRDTMHLHKLTTETFEFRSVMFPILESAGFECEGTLRDHHYVDGQWVNSLAHGRILQQ